MQHFLKIADGIDVGPLRAALDAHPELFGLLTHRAEGDSPHREMTDIWVRFNAYKNFGPDFGAEHDSVWYPSSLHIIDELKPIVFDLMRQVEGERLGGILITKLPPGGRIAPHVDGGWHAGYYQKFTIAIKSAPGALFRFPDGDIAASPGDCHWFDNSVLHSVENDTEEERIALIVCIKTRLYR